MTKPEPAHQGAVFDLAAIEVADLSAGRLLVLERGLQHDVEAVADSAFLLTLGWHADPR